LSVLPNFFFSTTTCYRFMNSIVASTELMDFVFRLLLFFQTKRNDARYNNMKVSAGFDAHRFSGVSSTIFTEETLVKYSFPCLPFRRLFSCTSWFHPTAMMPWQLVLIIKDPIVLCAIHFYSVIWQTSQISDQSCISDWILDPFSSFSDCLFLLFYAIYKDP